MEVKCFYIHIGSWPEAKNELYTCVVNSANITEPLTRIEKFDGVHLEGHNNKNVKALQFLNCVVEFVPRYLHRTFPNLERLQFYGCGLKEICRLDLVGLEKLRGLAVNKSKLKTLPDDLLVRMPHLTRIVFVESDIEFATSKLLDPVLNKPVSFIDLRQNKSIDATYNIYNYSAAKAKPWLGRLIDAKCKPAIPKHTAKVSHFPLKDLWTTEEHSDVVIKVGEKSFNVHKSVLAMRSKTFAKIFEVESEATEIIIKDFSEEAVETLLKFIYIGVLTETSNARENLSLASKFQIEKMKSTSEKILLDELYNENAFELFIFAHRYDCKYLMKEAFHVIDSMFQESLPGNLMYKPKEVMEMNRLRLR